MSDEVQPAPARVSRWDRPPPPRDWRWVVGNVGRVLVAVGLLMFGFVGYQLWGTGLEYAQAQDSLDDEFEELLAGTPPTTPATRPAATEIAPTTTLGPGATVPATSAPPPSSAAPAPISVPDFQPGDALARIEIPAIGLDTKVVSGVATADLKRGPGHYPDTPMPGQLGNAAIAGHRTTYGEPFADLDDVAPGDEIVLTTVQGRFVYRATGSEIVPPSASEVVATTDPSVARLTLTTCDPRFSATNRLIVYADLDAAASSAPQPPVVRPATPSGAPTPTTPATLPGGPGTTEPSASAGPPDTAPDTAPTTTGTEAPNVAPTDAPGGAVSEPTADAFSQGWFSDDGAFVHVALWGTVLTAVAVGAYLLSRAVRRNWVGALAGIVPFVVVVYFFFQNVNRLLPPAL